MKAKTFSGAIAGALMVALLSGCSAIAAHHQALFSNQPTRQTSIAPNEDPISGEWNVTFHVGDTAMPAVFRLKLDGTKVSGTAYSDHTGDGTIRDGRWSDGKLSFAVDFKKHESLLVNGALKDGELAGECHHPEGPTYKWEATPVAKIDDPISGEWNVTFYVHQSKTPATFTFKLDGTKVTGSAYSDHTGLGTIRDGKWIDRRMSFTLDFQKHQSIVVNGALKDGKLSGEFTTEGFTDKWEAKKK